MVRLEGIKDLADKFVRVRQPAIDDADIHLYEFDFDLTMMIFFVSPDEEIYGRFGGRAGQDPDGRQSLAGLRYAMAAALKTHESDDPLLAPRVSEKVQRVRDLPGLRRGGCVHCHQVKETLDAQSKRNKQWTRYDIWSYPPPDNLGLVLEVDRGDVVEKITPNSPAADAGLQVGDVIESIRGLPVNSFGDAQYALHGAPATGEIDITWQRGDERMQGKLALDKDWRRNDISWRRSMEWTVPSARVFGRNLNEAERKEHGLSPAQLAFWQSYPVSKAAADAGVREQDIILGFDGKQLEMTPYGFLAYVRQNYLSGDKVKIDVLRDGRRLQLPMTLP